MIDISNIADIIGVNIREIINYRTNVCLLPSHNQEVLDYAFLKQTGDLSKGMKWEKWGILIRSTSVGNQTVPNMVLLRNLYFVLLTTFSFRMLPHLRKPRAKDKEFLLHKLGALHIYANKTEKKKKNNGG